MNFEHDKTFKLNSTEYRKWVMSSLKAYFVDNKGISAFSPVEYFFSNGDVAAFYFSLYRELEPEYKKNFVQAIPEVIRHLGTSSELISAYIELFELVRKLELYNCIEPITRKLTCIKFDRSINDEGQNIYFFGIDAITSMIDGPKQADGDTKVITNELIISSLEKIAGAQIFENKFFPYSPKLLLALCIVNDVNSQNYFEKLGEYVIEFYKTIDDSPLINEGYYTNFLQMVSAGIHTSIADQVLVMRFDFVKKQKLSKFNRNIFQNEENARESKMIESGMGLII